MILNIIWLAALSGIPLGLYIYFTEGRQDES